MAQLEPAQQKQPLQSDPAQPSAAIHKLPEITFQWESFAKIIRELVPLFVMHWEEALTPEQKEAEPLDINFEAYGYLERIGVLRIYTSRQDGKLTGYIFFVLSPNLHSRKIFSAMSDMYFLLPEYRKSRTGFKLFKKPEIELKKDFKVHRILILSRYGLPKDTSKFFKRLGYDPTEEIFCKRL